MFLYLDDDFYVAMSRTRRFDSVNDMTGSSTVAYLEGEQDEETFVYTLEGEFRRAKVTDTGVNEDGERTYEATVLGEGNFFVEGTYDQEEGVEKTEVTDLLDSRHSRSRGRFV